LEEASNAIITARETLCQNKKFYSTTPKGFEFIRKYAELLALSLAGNLQVAEKMF